MGGQSLQRQGLVLLILVETDSLFLPPVQRLALNLPTHPHASPISLPTQVLWPAASRPPFSSSQTSSSPVPSQATFSPVTNPKRHTCLHPQAPVHLPAEAFCPRHSYPSHHLQSTTIKYPSPTSCSHPVIRSTPERHCHPYLDPYNTSPFPQHTGTAKLGSLHLLQPRLSQGGSPNLRRAPKSLFPQPQERQAPHARSHPRQPSLTPHPKGHLPHPGGHGPPRSHRCPPQACSPPHGRPPPQGHSPPARRDPRTPPQAAPPGQPLPGQAPRWRAAPRAGPGTAARPWRRGASSPSPPPPAPRLPSPTAARDGSRGGTPRPGPPQPVAYWADGVPLASPVAQRAVA